MRLTRGLILAALTLGALAALWKINRPRAEVTTQTPLLPGFSAQQSAVSKIEIRGANNQVLALLKREKNGWAVSERNHWPADTARIDSALVELAKAQRFEAKTSQAKRYARLGVQAISEKTASGVLWTLSAGKQKWRVLLGDASAVGEHRYARINDEAQAWLVDQALDFPRIPEAWLDMRLITRPLARIDRVRVQASVGDNYELSRVDGVFSLDGQPPQAMADNKRGNATAAALDGLLLADVAPAGVLSSTAQKLEFIGVDGLDITLSVWRSDDETWLSCAANLDAQRASAWQAIANTNSQEALTALKTQRDEITNRCAGKQFRIDEPVASILLRSRENFLADL